MAENDLIPTDDDTSVTTSGEGSSVGSASSSLSTDHTEDSKGSSTSSLERCLSNYTTSNTTTCPLAALLRTFCEPFAGIVSMILTTPSEGVFRPDILNGLAYTTVTGSEEPKSVSALLTHLRAIPPLSEYVPVIETVLTPQVLAANRVCVSFGKTLGGVSYKLKALAGLGLTMLSGLNFIGQRNKLSDPGHATKTSKLNSVPTRR